MWSLKSFEIIYFPTPIVFSVCLFCEESVKPSAQFAGNQARCETLNAQESGLSEVSLLPNGEQLPVRFSYGGQ